MYRYNIDLVASILFAFTLNPLYTKKPPRLAANGTKEKTIKGMKPIAIEVPFRITHDMEETFPQTSSFFFRHKEGGDSMKSPMFFFLSEICF